MAENKPVECEYLQVNKFCKAAIDNVEGKVHRKKWCPDYLKYNCCYLCVRHKFCEIGCTHLGNIDSQAESQGSIGIDQETARGLRVRVLEMITRKARLNFPITESDCPLEDRREMNRVVHMLCKYEVNQQDIRKMKRKLKLARFFAEDSERDQWLDQIYKLEHENSQITVEVERKVGALADSISQHVLANHRLDFQELIDALKNKGIVLEKLECPHCGGLLQVSEVPKREQMLQCRYCGSSILAMNLYEKFKEIFKL